MPKTVCSPFTPCNKVPCHIRTPTNPDMCRRAGVCCNVSFSTQPTCRAGRSKQPLGAPRRSAHAACIRLCRSQQHDRVPCDTTARGARPPCCMRQHRTRCQIKACMLVDRRKPTWLRMTAYTVHLVQRRPTGSRSACQRRMARCSCVMTWTLCSRCTSWQLGYVMR
jgi:hypothetical protein